MDESKLNLLAQYLSGAGTDLLTTGKLGPGLNAVTQQQVALKGSMNLLKTLLGGGGKITLDKDNISIKAPSASLGGVGNEATEGANAAVSNDISKLNDDKGLFNFLKNLLTGSGGGDSGGTTRNPFMGP